MSRLKLFALFTECIFIMVKRFRAKMFWVSNNCVYIVYLAEKNGRVTPTTATEKARITRFTFVRDRVAQQVNECSNERQRGVCTGGRTTGRVNVLFLNNVFI